MRRFVTAISLLAASLAFAACAQVTHLFHHSPPEVYHAPLPPTDQSGSRDRPTPPAPAKDVIAPPHVDTVKPAPASLVHYPVRYEQRPFVDHVLLFNADGTYVVFRAKDSVITQKGRYTFHGDTLLTDDCVLQAANGWVKGNCLSDGSIWRQVPLDTHWPPAPKTLPPVAFLPGARSSYDSLLNAH